MILYPARQTCTGRVNFASLAMYEVRNNSIVNEHNNMLAVFLPSQNKWVPTCFYVLCWWHGEGRSLLYVISKLTDNVVATFDAKVLAAGVIR